MKAILIVNSWNSALITLKKPVCAFQDVLLKLLSYPRVVLCNNMLPNRCKEVKAILIF